MISIQLFRCTDPSTRLKPPFRLLWKKGLKCNCFSPRSLQSERIEVDYEELVLVKDSLDFLRILRLGKGQHEENARLLRVVHHGAHEAFP